MTGPLTQIIQQATQMGERLLIGIFIVLVVVAVWYIGSHIIANRHHQENVTEYYRGYDRRR